MPTLIAEPDLEKQLRRLRKRRGLDGHDEVWNGVYFMPPLANNEHQEIVARLTMILGIVVELPGHGKVRPGVNLSDRRVHWKKNFRVPDVVVFLNNTKAINCDTFWLGGPDFAVEVMTKGDKSRRKLPFYAKVRTRELMLIDRDPWSVELYRLNNDTMALVGASTLSSPTLLNSQVVPLNFKLAPASVRPVIEVTHHDGAQRWII